MQDNDTFNNFINELIDKNDILDVVREYVDLTRKGNSYWGRCPFHHEKTASFHVEERLKIYKCFGCGAAGNVIKFVQEIESVSFMEAVKILADRVGMEVPKFSKRKEDNFEEKKTKQELHLKIVAVAARYYNTQLMLSEKMLGYLHSHGVDRKTITKYGIGYSPSLYGLVSHLISLGYSEKDIEDAGVCQTTENDKFQDVMAGRIVCPHINTFGKVVGFAGSMRNGETIYTKNTDIFWRDNEVWGTHVIKAIKLEEPIDSLIVTSTPINALALAAKGYRKVVSVMDNSISSRQARAMMRFTDKFTILFSGAEDGLDKGYQGLDPLINEGASCKVASLLENVVVFDFVEMKKFDHLVRRIKGAKSLLEYQLDMLSRKYDLTNNEGKEEYVLDAKGYIMAIKERSKQEPYISVLSSIAKVREDAIRKMFYQDGDKSNGGVKRITNKKGKTYNAMMSLLSLMYAGYDIGEDISEYLEGEYLDYYNAVKEDKDIELSAYFTDSEQVIIKAQSIDNKANSKLCKDCIKILKDADKKKRRDALVDAIDREEDAALKGQLLKELNELMKG